MRIGWFVLFCWIGSQALLAQQTVRFELIDSLTSAPIAYATLYNARTGNGTVTDERGTATLTDNQPGDTIQVAYLGYREVRQLVGPDAGPIRIRMVPRTTVLNAVTVLADDGYLYQLLAECRKRVRPQPREARTYLGVETFMNGQCIESLEAYFNGELDGYDLRRLDFKNGRVGLWPVNQRYFLSTETSRAFYLHQLTKSSVNFPVGPLELGRKACRRRFELSLVRSYTEPDGQVVEVIDFAPTDTSGGYFSGRVWVGLQDFRLRKIEYTGTGVTRHPFVPIGRADQLQRVDLRLAKTYEKTGETSRLESIDFDYEVDYRTRTGRTLSVRTAAVLYAYDYVRPFVLPRFAYVEGRYEDYRKIEATPYNPVFWQQADEFRRPAIAARLDTATQRLLSDERSVQLGSRPQQTLFQHYYLPWGRERFTFRSRAISGRPYDSRPKIKSDEYRLTGQIYLDINPAGDTLHVITQTVFDPFQSFYRLEQTPATAAFVNLYLDLVEMERRALVQRIEAEGADTTPRILKLYEQSLLRLKNTTGKYFKAVKRGEAAKEMRRWNAEVNLALGVDNVALFELEVYWASRKNN